MSVRSAKKFLQRMETDQDLQKKLESVDNLETRQQLIREAGFDFTLADYRQAVEEIAVVAGKQLTPEELQQVAAGLGRRLGSTCAPDFKMPPTLPD
jgi:predicted ribosomally synthesized peptide with nif11-like leader